MCKSVSAQTVVRPAALGKQWGRSTTIWYRRTLKEISSIELRCVEEPSTSDARLEHFTSISITVPNAIDSPIDSSTTISFTTPSPNSSNQSPRHLASAV